MPHSKRLQHCNRRVLQSVSSRKNLLFRCKLACVHSCIWNFSFSLHAIQLSISGQIRHCRSVNNLFSVNLRFRSPCGTSHGTHSEILCLISNQVKLGVLEANGSRDVEYSEISLKNQGNWRKLTTSASSGTGSQARLQIQPTSII